MMIMIALVLVGSALGLTVDSLGPCVRVSGAGLDRVNGIYLQATLHDCDALPARTPDLHVPLSDCAHSMVSAL